MGKQSRRQGRKVNKQAHKAKVQERKDRKTETSATSPSRRDSNGITKWDIFVDDRVWFVSSKSIDTDHNTRRGIVKRITESDRREGTFYFVQPISLYLRCINETWKIHEDDISRDMDNWSTRFDIGERVVVKSSSGWIPGVIEHLFPTCDRSSLYNIQCTQQSAFAGRRVAAESEIDVVKHPEKFRFSVGDRVLVDLAKAMTAHGRPIASGESQWTIGTVQKVDVWGLLPFYAVYECSEEEQKERSNRRITGKPLIWYVLQDTDEFIADVCLPPRQRRLDAIEQNCGHDHIDSIVREFKIEAPMIRDMLLAKAMEHGNFHVLVWLEEKLGINLASLRFPLGNNIFHEMLLRPWCNRFFRGFAELSKIASYRRLDLSITSISFDERTCEELLVMANDDGKCWFDLLLDRNDLRTFDFVFSPTDGLLWTIFGSVLVDRLNELLLAGRERCCDHHDERTLTFKGFETNITLLAQSRYVGYLSRNYLKTGHCSFSVAKWPLSMRRNFYVLWMNGKKLDFQGCTTPFDWKCTGWMLSDRQDPRSS